MPPETDLPAVAPSRPPIPAEGGATRGGAEAPVGNGPAAGRPGGRSGAALRVGGVLAVAALTVLVSLGVATLLGEDFREALLVEVETAPTGSVPAYSDAPREAARFFADRDSVTVSVPRDMSVADFLALYHLENNPGARAALRDQLGAAAPGDPLREGDRVTLPLTLRRAGPADPSAGEGAGAEGGSPISRDPGVGGPEPGPGGGS